ncbi:MAG: hypothetical protein KatS3mg076_0384 [Candidatus Binatia bacterium]|nr:MAG: hypothetical protein KatS3mg076_0384 [Candidatus Binatia bacterium]
MRKISCEVCTVRGEGAICNLPPSILREFQAIGVSSLYRPRQVVFSAGNPSTGLYLVCQGAVKLFHSDRFGREHILEVAGPRAVLGEFSLDAARTHSVSAEALTHCQLTYLPTRRLADFLRRHPETALHMLEALSHELALARRKVRDLALKRADSRLAALLLHLLEPGTEKIRLEYTRREIAEMVGVSTETAIRLLGRLRRAGTLEVRGREVVVRDLGRLARLAHYDETDA